MMKDQESDKMKDDKGRMMRPGSDKKDKKKEENGEDW